MKIGQNSIHGLYFVRNKVTGEFACGYNAYTVPKLYSLGWARRIQQQKNAGFITRWTSNPTDDWEIVKADISLSVIANS